MRLSSWRIRLSSFCCLVAACILALPFAGGQTQTAAPGKKTTTSRSKAKAPDTIPDGPPMTLEAILKMLNGVKQGIMDQPRIIAFINKRGLDFDAAPENIGKILTAGGSPELVDLISALKPPPAPPPPPPPPKPVTGTLNFSCAPAECKIRLDGGPDKLTVNGKLSIGDLVFRSYLVDIRKEGYLTKSEKVTVAGETSPEIAVTLEVLPETRAQWGKQLYTTAVQALGGAAGLAAFKTFSGSGGATSWNEQGSQSEWTIKSTFGTEAVYELNNPASGSFAISCQGETCVPAKGKGRKKSTGPEAESLNTNLRQYNRYHLMALLQRIGAPNYKLGANAAPVGGAQNHLLVTSPEETYDIVLSAANLPISVSYRSSDGLASAKITFAEYGDFGVGAKYPFLTSIALPGDKEHGIRVKYDTVAPGIK